MGRECDPGHDPDQAQCEQLDQVAALLAGAPDAALAERVYREHDWLRVTPTVLSFVRGTPVEIAVAP
jgi:hypothetical protein